MSDAMTDIARDSDRERLACKVFIAMLTFLEDETDENHKAMMDACKEMDSIPSGYWGGRTNSADTIANKIKRLKAGDDSLWCDLYADLYHYSHDPDISRLITRLPDIERKASK